MPQGRGVVCVRSGASVSSGASSACIASQTCAMSSTASASRSSLTRSCCDGEIWAGPEDMRVSEANGVASTSAAARAI